MPKLLLMTLLVIAATAVIITILKGCGPDWTSSESTMVVEKSETPRPTANPNLEVTIQKALEPVPTPMPMPLFVDENEAIAILLDYLRTRDEWCEKFETYMLSATYVGHGKWIVKARDDLTTNEWHVFEHSLNVERVAAPRRC